MNKPSRLQLFQYGSLAFPLAFAGLPLYIQAPDFYAAHLGVPLAALGGLLLALRSLDALQDPLIGGLSDRFHRWRPAIVGLGMLLLGGGFWMVFNPAPALPLFWLGASVMICTTGFSIVSINLQALGSLWQVPADERTRVAGWREAIGLFGLLAASLAPTLLMRQFDVATAYRYATLAYLPVLALGGLLFLRWQGRAELVAPGRSVVSERVAPAPVGAAGFGALWHDPWLRRFFAVYLVNMLASSIPAVLVIFFIRDYLQAGGFTGLFLLLYFLSGAGAMPLWPWIARRRGKAAAWGASMALASVTFVWAFFLGPGDIWPFAAVCVVSGIALGADLALPPAMLADHIIDSGHDNAASRWYALLALLGKAALALATGLMLPALALMGYQPGTVSTGAALPAAYALAPCVMKAAVAAWLWRMPGQPRIAGGSAAG